MIIFSFVCGLVGANLEPAKSKPSVNGEKSTLDLSSSNVEKEIQSLAVEALQRGSTAELVSSIRTLLLNQSDKEHEHEVYMSQLGKINLTDAVVYSILLIVSKKGGEGGSFCVKIGDFFLKMGEFFQS